jgi:Cu(I)/Ag(I) efflux system membrane fusion protein
MSDEREHGAPSEAAAPSETNAAHGDQAAGPPASKTATHAPPRGARTMAAVRWTLVLAMAAAAAFALATTQGWLDPGAGEDASGDTYMCPMHPSVVQEHPGQCPICSMSLVKREPAPAASDSDTTQAPGQAPAGTGSGAYWCPMHPEVTSDDPNTTCEKCGGMKLVPKPGDASGAAAPGATGAGTTEGATALAPVPGLVAVTLTPERVQLAGLRTARATRAALAPELRAVGTVSASEKGLAQVHARVAGWVEALYAEETGQRIKKGQVLARIYSPELLAAQQELLTAARWTGGDEAPALDLAGSARRRLELLGVAPADIDEIARGTTPIRALAIRSPVAGHVTRKNVVQGQYVQPGAPLFEVADLTKVWMLADVPEHELARVRLGARARVALAAFPERHLEGTVGFVYPTVTADTRTARLRVELANADLALRPGMYGDVHVDVATAEALVVPIEAVVDTGLAKYAFVAGDGGRFEPRRVRTGLVEGGRAQVLEGLVEGESVVTTANFLVDSESRLQAAIAGMTDAPVPDAPGAPSTPEDNVAPSHAEAPHEADTSSSAPKGRARKPGTSTPPQAPPIPAPSTQPATAAPTTPLPSPVPPSPAPAASPARPASECDREFDRARYADKYRQCLACEVQHRAMGTMVDDCKRAIAKPWR